MNYRLIALLLLSVLLSLNSEVGAQTVEPVPFYVPQIINVYPHDTQAYTQGLLFYDGHLYESTGAHAMDSTLREVDIETGEVLRLHTLSDDLYAEGLERVGDTLVQLTWKDGVALIYDIATFEELGRYEYEGEGWGLCSDGRYFYHSDGTAYLSVRELDTFDLIAKVLVTYQGTPINQLRGPNGRVISQLNELECVGDSVYANVWFTDIILQINKFDGRTEAVIDASNLITPQERADLGANDVLNGIVYNPETDTFYLTGKHWPKLYEVVFVPADR